MGQVRILVFLFRYSYIICRRLGDAISKFGENRHISHLSYNHYMYLENVTVSLSEQTCVKKYINCKISLQNRPFSDIFATEIDNVLWKKTVRTDGSEVKSLVLYFFFRHIYSPGVQLGQYKSHLGPRSRTNFFVLTKVIYFSCKKFTEQTVPERNLVVYIFFHTCLCSRGTPWSI